MLKIMVCLKRDEQDTPQALYQKVIALLEEYKEGFERISFSIADADVEPALPYRIENTTHPKDAVITLWNNHFFLLDAFYEALSKIVPCYQVYTAVESQPLGESLSPGRVPGMCQVALIKQPATMERKEWLQRWLGDHTRVAVETQSTFSYRQNIIHDAEPNGDWPLMDAIVEENFPEEAMTRRDVFFDAKDDEAKYKANEQRMIDSCLKFIDFGNFDCVPMSEYVIKS